MNLTQNAAKHSFEDTFVAWLTTFVLSLPNGLRVVRHSPEVVNVESSDGFRVLTITLKSLNQRQISDSKTSANQLVNKSIIIHEDLWFTKPFIIQSRLKALLGISERIPARLTKVRRVDKADTLRFLEENHLQGPLPARYAYGLYLPQHYERVLHSPQLFTNQLRTQDGMLVALATFAPPRIFTRETGPHRSFEMIRFANLAHTTVVGGLTKLLSHVVKEHQPNDIMTYVDLEWSVGQSFEKQGFKAVNDTDKHLFWVQPENLKRYPTQRLPEGLTELNAEAQGYLKVYTAGSRKFVLTIHP
ncbi:hypothetical protein [Arundinibacter roseus]|uniref:Uncharacterized protein n=1 Tax=Arundinibacter roseus TaxID=2070510 RepID=A0A4R4KFY5_9BACT|nr:hypothetical protein [Arundinibacter roseus]TDB66930.1 hypothetical protein EZE20_07355 [Arundinibacter roseus]